MWLGTLGWFKVYKKRKKYEGIQERADSEV